MNMNKKITFLIVLLALLFPIYSNAEIVNLGSISNRYYGDRINVSWDFSECEGGKCSDISGNSASVYLIGQGSSVQMGSGMALEDNISFTIQSSLAVGDYRVKVTKDNQPNIVWAQTGSFKILGNRSQDELDDLYDDGGSYEYDLDDLFFYDGEYHLVEEEDRNEIEGFTINSQTNGDLKIIWETEKDANVSIWAKCSNEISFYDEDKGKYYSCTKDRDSINIGYFEDKKKGELNLKPRDVAKKTRITFTIYALDGDGRAVDEREKTKNIDSTKITRISGSSSSNNNNVSVDNKSATNIAVQRLSKFEEIMQLARILKLNIDPDLIKLLILLEII